MTYVILRFFLTEKFGQKLSRFRAKIKSPPSLICYSIRSTYIEFKKPSNFYTNLFEYNNSIMLYLQRFPRWSIKTMDFFNASGISRNYYLKYLFSARDGGSGIRAHRFRRSSAQGGGERGAPKGRRVPLPLGHETV